MSEYNNYQLYRKEANRLLNFLQELNTNLKITYKEYDILILLMVGSTMEDVFVNGEFNDKHLFQYSQLFPSYINKFDQNTCKKKKLIQILVISPDNFFSSNSYVPTFLKFVNYQFDKTGLNEYFYSGNRNGNGNGNGNENGNENEGTTIIRVNIFNCLFPAKESRFNMIKIYNNLLDTLDNNLYDIKTFTQTNIDEVYIEQFYEQVEKLLSYNNNINKHVIINSWVCFKNLVGYSENYCMFPKLLQIANKYNIIATEWIFNEILFFTKIISSYHFGNNQYKNRLLLYGSENLTDYSPDIVEKNLLLSDDNTLFVINYESTHLLELFI